MAPSSIGRPTGAPTRDATTGSADLFCDQAFHFAVLGKAPEGLLGEQRLAVEADLEDPVLALDQLRIEAETLLQFGRQTGGSGLVVSNDAVFDVDSGHICGSFRGVGGGKALRVGAMRAQSFMASGPYTGTSGRRCRGDFAHRFGHLPAISITSPARAGSVSEARETSTFLRKLVLGKAFAHP